MTDEQLIDLSFKIDDLLYDFVNEKEIHPLSLTAVVLARLKHLNAQVDAGDDFNRLLQSVMETKFTKMVTIQ